MCRDRLNHIKSIALRVIAEDEFKPEPGDVVIPTEEEEVEPEDPKAPTYIGQRTQLEQTPSGERRRVYEGGGVQLKVCPVCGYSSPIHMPICNNCRTIFQELEKIVKKASVKSKTFNENNRQHRLALFGNLSNHEMGLSFRRASRDDEKVSLGASPGAPLDIKSPNMEGQSIFQVGTKRKYGPETLDQIWNTKGITELGPDTITEVAPTNQNRMEKTLLEMNSMRDEQGDLVMEEGIPKLQSTSNWYSLSHMLRDVLSVPGAKDAGITDAMLSMDEFYETVHAYNDANPDNSIGHIDIGATYKKLPQEDVFPEFVGKTEVGSGGRAVLQETIPDSKSAGFSSVWPLNDYTTPSGQARSGVRTVFAKRIEYVEVMKVLAEKAKLERQVEHYKTVADNASNDAKGDENLIKRKKNLSLLLELRNTDIESLDKPKKVIDNLEKSRNHLEKNHGEFLDELLDNISKYKEKETHAREKNMAALMKLQELLSSAQAPPTK